MNAHNELPLKKNRVAAGAGFKCRDTFSDSPESVETSLKLLTVDVFLITIHLEIKLY